MYVLDDPLVDPITHEIKLSDAGGEKHKIESDLMYLATDTPNSPHLQVMIEFGPNPMLDLGNGCPVIVMGVLP